MQVYVIRFPPNEVIQQPLTQVRTIVYVGDAVRDPNSIF